MGSTENEAEKIIKLFESFVSIDSVSFRERKMADYVESILTDMGISYEEDNAGEIYGGNAGNIYAYIDGIGEPLLLSAHLDTVEPGINKKMIEDPDGRIHTDGSTILGSDDAAGLTQIISALKEIIGNGISHRPIELLFPIGEEEYIKGSNVFDFSKIKSKEAYVLDLSGSVGSAANKAPTLISFVLNVKGRASHAGFAPQDGVNAIFIAALAISKIKQGQVDEETTLNIGTISGGTATNIISDECIVKGEIRSYSHDKALSELKKITETFEQEAKQENGSVIISHSIDLYAYEVSEDSKTVAHFKKACESLGIEPEICSTFGGSDNNNFVKNGIEGVVISCGMNSVHSTEEYIYRQELVKGVQLIKELVINYLVSN